MFDKVIISTDSQEIENIATSNGAISLGLRPKNLAQDTSDMFDAHKYVFDQLGADDSNINVILVSNNPFVDSSLLTEISIKAKSVAYEIIVTTATKVSHPYYFQFEQKDEKCTPLFQKEFHLAALNRQERKPTVFPYFLASAGKPSVMSSWQAYKNAMMNGFLPVYIDKSRTHDIDTELDWDIALAVYEKLFMGKRY